MRGLEGVVEYRHFKAAGFKRYALCLDSLHVELNTEWLGVEWPLDDELDYLTERNFVFRRDVSYDTSMKYRIAWEKPSISEKFELDTFPDSDLQIRSDAVSIGYDRPAVDVVPIYRSFPAMSFNEGKGKQDVIALVVEQFPVPGEMSSWEDIFDFKEEMQDKEWHFRRFLGYLAAKKLSEAEIRDDFEWTLHEYAEGMKRRKLKIVQSAIAAIVIPAAGFALNLPGSHIAALIGAGVALHKLQIEFFEGEIKAPGRECAYVLEAHKKFGSKR